VKTLPGFPFGSYWRVLLVLGFCSICVSSVKAAIVITPTGNAATLTNALLGSGVSVVGLPTLTGGSLGDANSSAALFTGGLSTGIGIDSGILLTTGRANFVGNTNTSTGTGISFGEPGDAQLTVLSGFPTFDATVLTFNFTTTTGDLFFNFAFASEEYNEYANSSVNDAFGFFVDGVNIALLPGTNIPISINTVNGGNPFGTDAVNSQFFNNNELGTFGFEYDGFTDVFTVSARGLSPGQHTIKLAIADGGDGVLDSGVFIQAGSFVTADPVLPPVVVPGGQSVPDTAGTLGLTTLAFVALAAFRTMRKSS